MDLLLTNYKLHQNKNLEIRDVFKLLNSHDKFIVILLLNKNISFLMIGQCILVVVHIFCFVTPIKISLIRHKVKPLR